MIRRTYAQGSGVCVGVGALDNAKRENVGPTQRRVTFREFVSKDLSKVENRIEILEEGASVAHVGRDEPLVEVVYETGEARRARKSGKTRKTCFSSVSPKQARDERTIRSTSLVSHDSRACSVVEEHSRRAGKFRGLLKLVRAKE